MRLFAFNDNQFAIDTTWQSSWKWLYQGIGKRLSRHHDLQDLFNRFAQGKEGLTQLNQRA